jgi:hypothetical protein
VTAVLQTVVELDIVRADAAWGQSYPSLTPDHPCAHLFERELWEQTGVLPDGHPWLNRCDTKVDAAAHGSARVLQRAGQDVRELGVGPIHASVIEQGHFRFMS